MLLADTILAGLFFADDGTCETHETEETCFFVRSLDQTGTMCIWEWEDSEAFMAAYENGGTALESDYGECAFNDPSGDFMPTLILTGKLSLEELGSYRFKYYSVLVVSNFMWSGALDSSDLLLSYPVMQSY